MYVCLKLMNFIQKYIQLNRPDSYGKLTIKSSPSKWKLVSSHYLKGGKNHIQSHYMFIHLD